MIVEDGTGLSDADAYISEAFFEAYCEARGVTLASGGNIEADIVRGTAWIDAEFGGQFPGTKLNGRDQSLLWPRTEATDREEAEIASDEVPIEIQNATAEAAIREHANPGSLSPDQAIGSSVVKRERIGSLEVEYAVSAGGSPTAPWYPIIAGILAPLIGTTSANASWVWR